MAREYAHAATRDETINTRIIDACGVLTRPYRPDARFTAAVASVIVAVHEKYFTIFDTKNTTVMTADSTPYHPVARMPVATPP